MRSTNHLDTTLPDAGVFPRNEWLILSVLSSSGALAPVRLDLPKQKRTPVEGPAKVTQGVQGRCDDYGFDSPLVWNVPEANQCHLLEIFHLKDLKTPNIVKLKQNPPPPLLTPIAHTTI